MKDFRGRSKTQCSKLKFSSESGGAGPVWEGLKGGGGLLPLMLVQAYGLFLGFTALLSALQMPGRAHCFCGK